MIPTSWRTYLATATDFRADVLCWFTARSFSTGLFETIGLWTGDDHEQISVNGVLRLYYSAAEHIVFPSGIPYEAGLDVQYLTIEVGPLTDWVQQLLRGYDAKQAFVEVHGMLRTPANLRIDPVVRYWKGRLDTAPIDTEGGWDIVNSIARLSIASSSRDGTKTLADTKSQAVYSQNGDGIGRYMAIGGTIRVPWGTEDVK